MIHVHLPKIDTRYWLPKIDTNPGHLKSWFFVNSPSYRNLTISSCWGVNASAEPLLLDRSLPPTQWKLLLQSQNIFLLRIWPWDYYNFHFNNTLEEGQCISFNHVNCDLGKTGERSIFLSYVTYIIPIWFKYKRLEKFQNMLNNWSYCSV